MDNLSFVLMVLFNPPLLVLLLILYFLGKLLGKLTVRMNIWKFLLLAYFGIFLIEPFLEGGWFFGTIFLLGFFSNHIARLPDILSWAEGLGDIYFAFKYRQTFEDLRSEDRRADESRRTEQEEAARQNSGSSRTQERWKEDAKQHRSKASGDAGNAQGQQRNGQNSGSENTYTRFNPQTAQGTKQGASTLRDQHLRTLGLEPGRPYSLREMKRAYSHRVIETHPDQGGSAQDLQRVRSAWEWLQKNAAT
jgi:hypothetical protein